MGGDLKDTPGTQWSPGVFVSVSHLRVPARTVVPARAGRGVGQSPRVARGAVRGSCGWGTSGNSPVSDSR